MYLELGKSRAEARDVSNLSVEGIKEEFVMTMLL